MWTSSSNLLYIVNIPISLLNFKFMQLLTQYIRRESRGMEGLMLQEAEEAEKQRRDFAKQMGEMAGTKLLLPMILLLVIVLMIVMVPAFLSM